MNKGGFKLIDSAVFDTHNIPCLWVLGLKKNSIFCRISILEDAQGELWALDPSGFDDRAILVKQSFEENTFYYELQFFHKNVFRQSNESNVDTMTAIRANFIYADTIDPNLFRVIKDRYGITKSIQVEGKNLFSRIEIAEIINAIP